MWEHNSQSLDTEEKWELHSIEKSGYWDLNLWNAISMFVWWLAPFGSIGFLIDSEVLERHTNCQIVAIRISLYIDEKLN